MISVQISGDKAIVAKFSTMNEKVKTSLVRTVVDLTIRLQKYIIDNKLSGQVLNHRTGNLWRSIHPVLIEASNTRIIGLVGSSGDVKYAAIHEYGGVIKTRLGTGKGPPKPNGKATIEMPERSFMRSSLADMRGEIKERLSAAVKEGMK